MTALLMYVAGTYVADPSTKPCEQAKAESYFGRALALRASSRQSRSNSAAP